MRNIEHTAMPSAPFDVLVDNTVRGLIEGHPDWVDHIAEEITAETSTVATRSNYIVAIGEAWVTGDAPRLRVLIADAIIHAMSTVDSRIRYEHPDGRHPIRRAGSIPTELTATDVIDAMIPVEGRS